MMNEFTRLPGWMRGLSSEDFQLIRRFLLASGSLKEVARDYGISYPTVRIRLDRLIEKVKLAERNETGDPFHRLVQNLLIDGKLSPDAAKLILREHLETQRKETYDRRSLV